MNIIKLQNLTPDVYYNQSRDFQFIGRLFDIVLNSTKTNSELLSELPLSQNSDQKLIELMTMTLGFKSQHNYNIKQLTALCSAFTVILRNKGNINSIMLAVNTLLNAEGIQEEAGYSLENSNTVLNLFIPQNLTDINLLRDLLNYILPAGMTCNIIREFTVTRTAASSVGSSDSIKHIWPNENGTYKVEMFDKSIIPQITKDVQEYSISSAKIGDVAGQIANSDVVQIKQINNDTKETN